MLSNRKTASKTIFFLIAVITVISLIAGMPGCNTSTPKPLPYQKRLKVATTTSLYHTGLWRDLEFMFEEQYNVELDVVYAGTGIALEYGRKGLVDVVTVHSKADEERFVAKLRDLGFSGVEVIDSPLQNPIPYQDEWSTWSLGNLQVFGQLILPWKMVHAWRDS